MIIIAVIAVAGFEVFRYCQNFIVDAELRFTAINRAREKMEELYFETGPPPPPADPEIISLNATTDAQRNYTVENDTSGNYMIIAVTVDW